MTNESKVRVFLQNLLILAAILLHSTTCISAQEVKDEHEFDYIGGSPKGPSHWGELKREWAACKNGKMQSPIDLSNRIMTVVPELRGIKKHYKPQNAMVKNRGHDIQVQWEQDAGSITINGTEFFLHQCHWHSPSEHTINGRRYDLELHMVHESKGIAQKKEIAVVGVLFQIGRPDPVLNKLSKFIETMKGVKLEKSIGVFDPSEIKLGGKKYYRYLGSLTTPPCTEGVIWILNQEIMSVSTAQIHLLRKAVHQHAEKNSRPVQPPNRRRIELCTDA